MKYDPEWQWLRDYIGLDEAMDKRQKESHERFFKLIQKEMQNYEDYKRDIRESYELWLKGEKR